MTFKHPNSDYTETVLAPFFFCLLFGPLYFIVKGCWRHAIIYTLIACTVIGLAIWLIYPFFARDIVRTHYLREGWTEI